MSRQVKSIDTYAERGRQLMLHPQSVNQVQIFALAYGVERQLQTCRAPDLQGRQRLRRPLPDGLAAVLLCHDLELLHNLLNVIMPEGSVERDANFPIQVEGALLRLPLARQLLDCAVNEGQIGLLDASEALEEGWYSPRRDVVCCEACLAEHT